MQFPLAFLILIFFPQVLRDDENQDILFRTRKGGNVLAIRCCLLKGHDDEHALLMHFVELELYGDSAFCRRIH